MAKTKEKLQSETVPTPQENPEQTGDNGAMTHTPEQPAVPATPKTSALVADQPEVGTVFGGLVEGHREVPRSIPIIKIAHLHEQFILPSGELTPDIGGYAIYYGSNRAYWKTAYDKARVGPPECASLDKLTPVVGCKEPQSKTCVDCKQNMFGSARDSKSKACAEITWTFLLNPMFGTPPIGVLMTKPSSHTTLHGSKFRQGLFAKAAQQTVPTPKWKVEGGERVPLLGQDGKQVVTNEQVGYYEIVWIAFTLRKASDIHCVIEPHIGAVCTDMERVRQIAAIRNQYLQPMEEFVGNVPDAETLNEDAD